MPSRLRNQLAEKPPADPAFDRHIVREVSRDEPLNLRRLKPVHRTIILRHFEGKTNQEIADEFGRTAGNVWSVLNSPIAQAEINRGIEAARATLKAVQLKAIARVSDSLNEEWGLRMNMQGVDRYIKLADHLGIREDNRETAEDVVGRIMNQVNVQVNVGSTGEGQPVTVSMDKMECDTLGDN